MVYLRFSIGGFVLGGGWQMQLNAKFTTDINGIVGEVGGTRDRASHYTHCGEDGDQALSDFGDIPIGFWFLDFGFYVVDVDDDVVLDFLGELGDGLAHGGDELEQFGGIGVVDLGELVISDLGFVISDDTNIAIEDLLCFGLLSHWDC
jgi:hypothetical protein